MKKANFLFLFILILSFTGNSQNYLGVHSSDYAGVMGTDLQPASFVDGRFVVDVNLFSTNFSIWTNGGAFDTKDMPKWWTKSFKEPYNDWTKPDSTFIDRYIVRNYDMNSTKPIGFYNNIQLDVLNFMFHINPKIALGVAVKGRSITNIDNIDPKLALLAEEELEIPSLWNQFHSEELLSINSSTWMEYGFIYSQVIKDDGEHFMKAGGKIKWQSGFAGAFIHTDNFKYDLENADTSARLSGDFSYAYTDMENTPGLGGNSKFGWGLDLGFVYEWRPDWKEYKYDMDGETNIWRRDKNKYKIRAGVSVLDIGGIKYNKAGGRSFNVNSNNLFDLHTFDPANDLEEFEDIVDSLITNDPAWTETSSENSFFMHNPTALSLQLDYNIWKWFNVNATGVIGLQSKKNGNRVHVPSQFTLTPSFDYAWFGLHIPVSINSYSGFKAGIGTRLGPLTLGVMDFKSLFATGKVNGTEFYAGMRIPILYSHPSDIDGDKVSDKLDECLVVQGVWEFRGCPDTDRDGIKDTEDECPNTPGLKEFNGCPDTDGDSIPDRLDDCPEVPGLKEFKGCPDTDGDGIIDSEDACPEVAGPVENNGCPDTDGDGLFDFIDDCPSVAGPKENNGCPWPDTDEDGLLDKDDKCPYLAGPIDNEGCPYQDTDNDGVLDKDDKCPATAGPVENDGCPLIEAEIQEILQTAFDNLEFETGKAIIKDESFPSLAELAKVLVKKPEWKLQIAGHTDNIGSAQTNLVLSKKRSEAVKAFLVSQGISEDRISALYFGETDPIADNSTKEGRQKNRRVEMTVVFE